MSTIGYQENFLIWLTSYQHPILNQVASFLTLMGDETFYMIVVPLIYWCLSKSVGFRLAMIVMFTLYVSTYIKFYVAVQRPVGVEGINSLFVESAKASGHFPYDSFPSGHAQGSASLWTYLAYIVAKPIFWVLAIFIVILISFSRLYTGLHWPSDVMAGLLIGVLITVIAIKLSPLVERLDRKMHWLLVLVIPIILALIAPGSSEAKASGFMFGAGVAFLLEIKYVRFNLRTEVWKKMIAYVIGIGIAVVIKSVLKSIFPEMIVFEFIRYAVMGLWVFFLAPTLFVRLRLYHSDRTGLVTTPPTISG